MDTTSNWSFDKDLKDFIPLVKNLRLEGQASRADAINYLIERIMHIEREREDKSNVTHALFDEVRAVQGYKCFNAGNTAAMVTEQDGVWVERDEVIRILSEHFS